MTPLGKFLRQQRHDRAWPLRQAAVELCVSHPYLCDVENGLKLASKRLLLRASLVYMTPHTTIMQLDRRSRPIRIDPRAIGDEAFCAILAILDETEGATL